MTFMSGAIACQCTSLQLPTFSPLGGFAPTANLQSLPNRLWITEITMPRRSPRLDGGRPEIGNRTMHISEQPKLVTIYGGSGFVGRHVVRVLARRGYRIRIAVRRPDLAYHLQPLGNVGQIRAVQTNLRYRWSVARAAEGAEVVINLVAILRESGAQKFAAVNQRGSQYVAEAAAAAGARLIHVSAIGADPESPSIYASTKGEAERQALRNCKDAIIFRPSIVFGPEDEFFNRFAAMARISPFLPLIGGGQTRFQPVFVGDVAEAIARAVDGELKEGRIYELGGPEIFTFRQCMEIVTEAANRPRFLVSVPWFLARGLARAFGWLPFFPITADQVRQLERDNVVSEQAQRQGRTLEGIGIKARTVDSIVPGYLVRFRPHGQFTRRGAA
jgi:uncharacterized protein YbjT (DUF2867 family)